MGYTLQAILGHSNVLRPVVEELPAIDRPQGFLLLPLTTDVRASLGDLPGFPCIDARTTSLPEPLYALCQRLSLGGPIAYIEAEFFGGIGTQAALVAAYGEVIQGPEVHRQAINKALRELGVTKGRAYDEFEALNLQQHRHTDDWLSTPP